MRHLHLIIQSSVSLNEDIIFGLYFLAQHLKKRPRREAARGVLVVTTNIATATEIIPVPELANAETMDHQDKIGSINSVNSRLKLSEITADTLR